MMSRTFVALLSAALTSATAAAAVSPAAGATAQSHAAARPNYDAFYAKSRATTATAGATSLRAKQVARQRSAAGYASQFDPLRQQATFLWATDTAPVSVGPVKAAALPEALGRRYLGKYAGTLGLDRSAITSARLIGAQKMRGGSTISRFQQRVGDIEVFGRQLNVLTGADQRLVAISGSFDRGIVSKSGFARAPEQAITAAVGDLGGSIVPVAMSTEKSAGGYLSYSNYATNPDYLLERPVRVKQVYFPLPGTLEPAYYIEVIGRAAGSKRQDGYSYVVSASTGEILFRNNLIAHEGGSTAYTYRVFADPSGIKQPYDSPLGNSSVPFAGATPQDVPARQSATANRVTLVSGPISTGDAWLPDGATTTTGNHADAYLDTGLQLDPGIYLNNQPFDWPGDGYVPLTGDLRSASTDTATFDYPIAADDDPAASDAKQAAIVNLFYMNNWLHDWWYDHGFDEAAGNAQTDNYGRGGIDGDPIQAQGQDAGGRNNANMLTPGDGSSPRMQMYLFDGSISGEVCQQSPNDNCPSTAAGDGYRFSGASFGPSEFDVTGELVLIDDGSEPVTNGCNDNLLIPDPIGLGLVPDTPLPDPTLAGSIVLIDRGSCSFTTKEQYAMLSGAAAMIVINNGEGEPISMGNADIPIDVGFTTDGLYITPAVMISKASGDALKAQLAAGDSITMRVLREPSIDYDGTLDNLVIAHEYFHYVSNRLISDGNGLSNNQGGSLGEGWGDISAWMLSVREDDVNVPGNGAWQGAYPSGYYVLDSFYYGIRRMPYSADFGKNLLTFKHIEDGVPLEGDAPVGFGTDGATNSEVHNAGEVWANTMFHAYTMLLTDPRHSFSEAQSRMKDYIICGMKMTPSSPTYTEARDGVLACAKANDVVDFSRMAKAFALRGMGVEAVSPARDSTDHAGVVESYVAVIAQAPSLIAGSDDGTGDCDADGILDAGEYRTLRFELLNNGAYAAGDTVRYTLSSDSAALGFVDGNTLSFTAGAIGETSTADILVELSETAPSPLTVTLTLTASPLATPDPVVQYPDSVTLTLLANYDAAQTATSDDFEIPALSVGDWTVNSTGTTTVWSITDENDITGSGLAWFAPDLDTQTEIQLVSPAFVVPADTGFTLGFDHYYEFEEVGPLLPTGYDGGYIDVSVDGGEWVDAETFGVSFANGYDGTIQANGRSGYTGSSGGVVTETLDFGTLVAGHSVRVRFSVASDELTGAFGWIVDNLTTTGAEPAFTAVSEELGVCDVTPPDSGGGSGGGNTGGGGTGGSSSGGGAIGGGMIALFALLAAARRRRRTLH